jgi:cyanophycinase
MPEPGSARAGSARAGSILAIGGHEDRTGGRAILGRISAALGGRPLALITAASEHPGGYVDLYRDAFAGFGVEVLHVSAYESEDAGDVLARAGGAFLTGGSQLRLVHRLRSAGLVAGLVEMSQRGGIVAGTSAGASALAGRMIVRGPGRRSPSSTNVHLGNGLGLIEGVIIDQHFAERGRSGRLRAAVADDPDCVGIGIDEDTAVEFRGTALTVHGSGAVTIIDARRATTTTSRDGRSATIRKATLHILAAGDSWDLTDA